MSLSKDQILGSNDLVGKAIAIPEWDGDVYVGIMSGHELNRFQKYLKELEGDGVNEDTATKITRMAAMLICDEKGERLFDESDIPNLLKKSFSAMKRIMELAMDINGMTKKEASELVGEFESGQS